MGAQREGLDRALFKRCLAGKRLVWRRHALERMLGRGISRRDITAVLAADDRIEEYPEDFPFPSALFAGTMADRMIHVVAGLDADGREIHVISAYEPDAEHFEADGRTRRSRAG